MTGIVHLRDRDRFSRRSVVAGAAGLVLAVSTPQAMPLGAQTPEASPATRGGTFMTDARDRLRSLLALLPADSLENEEPTATLMSWADWQTQFAALGVEDPFAESTNIVAVTRSMTSTDDLVQYALAEDVRAFLGFSAFEVHQVLVGNAFVDRIAVYAGGVDFSGLTATWETSGYERKSGPHGDYWTLGEAGELDFSRPGPVAVGGLNNVALLADDIAVFTPTYAGLERVLAHASEGGPSAADDEGLTALIDMMPENAVNVLAFPGATFRADTMVPENPGMETSTMLEDLLAESDTAVGPMPEVLLSLCGVTAGAAMSTNPDEATPDVAGDAQAFMSFLMASEDDARAAAAVAFWRLENMQSPTTGEIYKQRFVPVNTSDEAIEGDVMVVRFGGDVAGAGMWYRMILSRDTWPFAWLGEP